MDTYDARHEMVTLPEAAALAAAMGHHLDRSSLLCYARAGRLPAHKRHGVWLTTRAAVQALVLELAEEAPTHPRTVTTPWAEVTLSPELVATLTAIDHLRAALARPSRGPAGDDRQPRPAPAAAPHHADPHADNPLSSPAARRRPGRRRTVGDALRPGGADGAASGRRGAPPPDRQYACRLRVCPLHAVGGSAAPCTPTPPALQQVQVRAQRNKVRSDADDRRAAPMKLDIFGKRLYRVSVQHRLR